MANCHTFAITYKNDTHARLNSLAVVIAQQDEADTTLVVISRRWPKVIYSRKAELMNARLKKLALRALLIGATSSAQNVMALVTVLPTAIWSGSITATTCASSIFLCGSGTVPITGPGVTGAGQLQVIASPTPAPSIFSLATVPAVSFPTDYRSATADAQLLYNIQITCTVGNVCATAVPIGSKGVGFVSTSTGPTASSSVKLEVGSNVILSVASSNGVITSSGTGITLPVTGGFAYSDTFMLTSNFIYTVLMTATADVSTTLGVQSATAYLDPIFFIDPTFPNADIYSILISPGIGNSLPVPEPSEWMMFLIGLAILLLRFRKGAYSPVNASG